jgi:hypothetical protein
MRTIPLRDILLVHAVLGVATAIGKFRSAGIALYRAVSTHGPDVPARQPPRGAAPA